MEENLNDKLIPLTNAKPEEVDEALTGQPTTVQKTDKELQGWALHKVGKFYTKRHWE